MDNIINTKTEAPKKICIMEDDNDIRDIYSTKLRSEGYEILEAINGEEGMRIVKEKKPDLILLDLLMPIKNGYEVLKEIEQDNEIASIPVIILTNLDDEDSADKVGKYETRFYVIKSLTTPQKLFRIVKEVLH